MVRRFNTTLTYSGIAFLVIMLSYNLISLCFNFINSVRDILYAVYNLALWQFIMMVAYTIYSASRITVTRILFLSSVWYAIIMAAVNLPVLFGICSYADMSANDEVTKMVIVSKLSSFFVVVFYIISSE